MRNLTHSQAAFHQVLSVVWAALLEPPDGLQEKDQSRRQ